MSKLVFAFLTIVSFGAFSSQENVDIPDTGISGVYEAMIGTDDAKPLLTFYQQFGFEVKKQASFSAKEAKALYGVDSALTAYRLQNGAIDSHGLIRILQWQKPTGEGVGYAPPETVGQRLMVMRTKDIFRIYDIFSDARSSGEPWFPTHPVYDDLYDMTEGKLNVINRRVGVREMASWGQSANIVFYQRYGYTIPGYGTIGDHAPLATSEVTHNDFMLGGHTKADMHEQTDYYRDVFGFKPEGPVVIDGDWQAGPKTVFNMADGATHWYRGFVSPNNISGKLKFFVNPDKRPNRANEVQPGAKGINIHSLYTDKLKMVHQLAQKHQLAVSDIQRNEFGEKAFLVTGADGAYWQIIQTPKVENPPKTKLEFVKL